MRVQDGVDDNVDSVREVLNWVALYMFTYPQLCSNTVTTKHWRQNAS